MEKVSVCGLQKQPTSPSKKPSLLDVEKKMKMLKEKSGELQVLIEESAAIRTECMLRLAAFMREGRAEINGSRFRFKREKNIEEDV